MFRFLVIMAATFVLTSCAHSPKAKPMADDSSSVIGTVLNQELLAKGGDIALVAFKAGPKAEANDELDRLSLMIIKGIKDSLDHQNTSLHVIELGQAQPVLALEGYIEERSKTGKLSRMMLKPRQENLVIAGELWLTATGERLLNFSIRKTFHPKKEKLMDVAYALGKDIGDFIASHAK